MLLLYVPIWVLGLEILKQHDSNCQCTGYLIACVDLDGLVPKSQFYVYMCVYVEQCNSGEAYMPRTQTDNGEKGSMD